MSFLSCCSNAVNCFAFREPCSQLCFLMFFLNPSWISLSSRVPLLSITLRGEGVWDRGEERARLRLCKYASWLFHWHTLWPAPLLTSSVPWWFSWFSSYARVSENRGNMQERTLAILLLECSANVTNSCFRPREQKLGVPSKEPQNTLRNLLQGLASGWMPFSFVL